MSKDKVVLVTQNKHKIEELTPLFNEYEVEFDTTPLEKHEVRSDDVEVVAKEAAVHAFRSLGRAVVVDDTGLYIPVLNDFPKSYAAFVLDTIGKSGILRLMDGVTERSADFITAVGYSDRSTVRTFVGKMPGAIATKEAGTGGFGYDPIFVPEGFEKTYAQLELTEKVEISHRTKAFHAFLEWYTTR